MPDTAWAVRTTGRPRAAAHTHGTSHTPGHPHNCTCLECCDRAAAWANRKRRHKAYGTWQPFVPIGPVLEHIAMLNAAGMSDRQLVQLAQSSMSELHKMRTRRQKLRPDTAARFLAVRLDLRALDPKAFLPARGAARRVQGLRAIGWPNRELAERSRLHRDSVHRIHEAQFVWASTLIRIQEVYEDLHDQDPTVYGVPLRDVERSRSEARLRRWVVPAAWTDIDTDEKPDRCVRRMGYRYALGNRPSLETVGEVRQLAAGGADRAKVAERLGVPWDTIATAFTRAGEPLPLVLR